MPVELDDDEPGRRALVEVGELLARERQDAHGGGVRPGRVVVAGARAGDDALVVAVRGHRPDAGRALPRARERDPGARRRPGRLGVGRGVGRQPHRRGAVRGRDPDVGVAGGRDEYASCDPFGAKAGSRWSPASWTTGLCTSVETFTAQRSKFPSRSVAKRTREPSASQAGSTSRPALAGEQPLAGSVRVHGADVVVGAPGDLGAVRRPGRAAVGVRRVREPLQRVRLDLERVDVVAAHERDRAPVRRPRRLRRVLGEHDADPGRRRDEREPALGRRGDRRRRRRRSKERCLRRSDAKRSRQDYRSCQLRDPPHADTR